MAVRRSRSQFYLSRICVHRFLNICPPYTYNRVILIITDVICSLLFLIILTLIALKHISLDSDHHLSPSRSKMQGETHQICHLTVSPTSKLSVLSKVLEKLVAILFAVNLDASHLSSLQSAFQRENSTETVLLKILTYKG